MPKGEFVRILPNGIVENVQETVTRRTTLGHFYDEVKRSAPSKYKSPILPRNCVAYYQDTESGDNVENLTMFHASEVRTICYLRQSQRNNEDAIQNYNIAFPHMVMRFQFRNGNLGSMFVGVMKEVPEHYQQRVYHMKMHNVHPSGQVCIPLEPSPGDLAKSCYNNADLFFHRSPFSSDLPAWPQGIRSFSDWEALTTQNPGFILEKNWPDMITLGDFVEGKVVSR